MTKQKALLQKIAFLFERLRLSGEVSTFFFEKKVAKKAKREKCVILIGEITIL